MLMWEPSIAFASSGLSVAGSMEWRLAVPLDEV